MSGLIGAIQVGRGGLDAGLRIAEKVREQRRQEQEEEALKRALQNVGDWNGLIQQVGQANPHKGLELALADRKLQQENALTPYQKRMLELQEQKLKLEDGRTTSMKDYEYFTGLTPEEQEQYLRLKKAGATNITLSPYEKKRIENVAKKADENIADAEKRLNTAKRGEALLNQTTTGGFAGVWNKYVPNFLKSDDAQSFESLANELIPQQRQAGSGSMSDSDAEMYEKATISLTKDEDTNRRILQANQAVAENDIAYEELKGAWISDGGKIADFDKQWRQYSNENPVFDKTTGGRNLLRKDPYEYFDALQNVDQVEQETSLQRLPTKEEAIAELKRRGRI
jgi:hypothetical protein